MRVVGRLKPGVTLSQARGDMDAIGRGLAAAFPAGRRGLQRHGAVAERLDCRRHGRVSVRPAGRGGLCAADCVRKRRKPSARARHRPLARVCDSRGIGRGPWRVIRQLLTESVLLSAAGGALGLLVAAWGTHAVISILPDALPRSQEIGMDSRVFIFTAIVSVACGILFGLGARVENLAAGLAGNAQGRRPRIERHAPSRAGRLRHGRSGDGAGAVDRRGPHAAKSRAPVER